MNQAKTLNAAEDVFKSLVWDQWVKANSAALLAKLGLAWWPAGPILSFVIGRFADLLYRETKLAIQLQAIRFKNVLLERAYNKSFVTLMLMAEEKGAESKEYLEAKENAKAALARFLHMGP